jgi:hypothetical protein
MRMAMRVFFALALLALALPATALAGHTTDPATNLTPLGHLVEPRITGGPNGPNGGPQDPGGPDIHTDLGFWGNIAVQGSWLGFHLRDVSNPAAPATISYTTCAGNQGDVMIYRNLVVRSWNSPAGRTTGPLNRADLSCDGQAVPLDFEGLHVFDISNRADPQLVASVATPNGSHTATAVPDPENNRLLVYNAASNAGTPQIDVVSVPLTAPQNATLIRSVPAGGACHDIQVMFEPAWMVVCSGGIGFRVFSIGGERGGSKTFPELLYGVRPPGVTTPAHSASLTWNGEIVIWGWEPGGGAGAECEAEDPASKKSFFFYRADDGALLGTWTLPRPQSSQENCTLHNFNVVPFLNRHVMVHGSYQAGTGVIDFTNPANAVEVAFSDPPPEPVPPVGSPARFCTGLDPATPARPTGCALGGAWATYWYNGPLYESNISEGLNVWQVNEAGWNNAVPLTHMNPQTQDAVLTCEGRISGPRLVARRHATLRINLRALSVSAEGEGPSVAARNVAVRLRGVGINRTVRTNSAGRASLSIHPMRAGTIRLSASALNMQPCTTTLRVNRAPRAGGGNAGGGASGPGLTGRIG